MTGFLSIFKVLGSCLRWHNSDLLKYKKQLDMYTRCFRTWLCTRTNTTQSGKAQPKPNYELMWTKSASLWVYSAYLEDKWPSSEDNWAHIHIWENWWTRATRDTNNPSGNQATALPVHLSFFSLAFTLIFSFVIFCSTHVLIETDDKSFVNCTPMTSTASQQ